ncbi:DUF3994 domain-containing protein, partial [Bacillus cereus]
ESIKDLDKVFTKIERIDSQGKYKEDHKEIEKAVQKLKESFKEASKLFDYSKTVKDTDYAIIDKANNKLDEAKRIWKPVFNKLKAEANGGSTTTSTTSGTSSSNSPSLSSGNKVKTYSTQDKTGIFKGKIDTPDED